MIMSEKKKNTLSDKIAEQFLNGLIVLVPPVITAFAVFWILNLTEGEFAKYLPIKFPGAGLISILFLIWIVGIIGGHALTKKIIHVGELILGKIPVVKFIYSSVKQFSTAVFESDSSFQKVVLVPYHESLALGFLMDNVPAAIQEKIGDEYICVFDPWSLNMTSGKNLFIKKSNLIFVDMKSEDALKFLFTAGTVSEK